VRTQNDDPSRVCPLLSSFLVFVHCCHLSCVKFFLVKNGVMCARKHVCIVLFLYFLTSTNVRTFNETILFDEYNNNTSKLPTPIIQHDECISCS
jgi:hypothetical protein